MLGSKKMCLTLVGVVGMQAGVASAAVLAQDSFLTGPGNYDTASTIVGQNPPTTGFSTAWTVVGNNDGTPTAIVPTGLTYTGLDTAGGAFSLRTGNNRYGRLLDTAVSDATTGTMYLSILMDVNAVDGQYKAFELFNGGFADTPDRNFRLGNGGGANSFNDNDFGFRVASGTLTTLGAGNTDTNLFVARFDLSSVANSDTVTVYRNPTDLLNEANNTGFTISGQNIAFDRIAFAMFTNQPVTFDEFRLTTTFAEAVVPEPASLALMGLGGLAMLARRRK